MSFLLTPEDERELAVYLRDEMGARLLLSDIAPHAEPQIAVDPLQALPVELPPWPRPESGAVYELLFWLSSCGQIKTMRDAPETATAQDKVTRYLMQDAASDNFKDVIDISRTPVLLLHRSKIWAPNRLVPGSLSTMAVKASALPQNVKSAHTRVTRWLKNRGAKIDPFLHCPEVKERRPVNLGPLWVWAQPYATELVEQGIEIWPWNA